MAICGFGSGGQKLARDRTHEFCLKQTVIAPAGVIQKPVGFRVTRRFVLSIQFKEYFSYK